MDAQYTGWYKPNLVFLVSRKRKNKHREQRKQRNGVAIRTNPNAVRSINSDHLQVLILKKHEGFEAKSCKHKIAGSNDLTNKFLIIIGMPSDYELVKEEQKKIK